MKKVIAHRGMSTLAPENTLSALKLCKEHGISWVEFDVSSLGDGTLVVVHDDTLDRCSNKSGSLSDITVADLADIDVGFWFSDSYQGEKLPTLKEVIALLNEYNINANVEIKADNLDKATCESFLKKITEEISLLKSDVIVSSFNHLLLKEFKKLNPDIATACLFTKDNLWDDWKAILQCCDASYIHPEEPGLTKKQVQSFVNAGFKVNVWTVNSLSRANELLNWGVEGICTDIAQDFPSIYKNK